MVGTSDNEEPPATRQGVLQEPEEPGSPMARPKSTNRYDLQALLRLTRETSSELILRLGPEMRRNIWRWENDGLTARAADLVATRSGYHPQNVWPHWELDQPDPDLGPCGHPLTEYSLQKRGLRCKACSRRRKNAWAARQRALKEAS